MRDGRSAFLIYPDNAEADGLADARDDGNILLNLARAAIKAFLARKDTDDSSEIKVEIHLGVTEERGLLEHRSVYHRAFKTCKR